MRTPSTPSSPARPALRIVEPGHPEVAAPAPRLDWTARGDGRFELHAPAIEAVLSPVPAGQAVRLLEVNGEFHILTGRIRDDRAMQVLAEDVLAGFPHHAAA